MATISAELDPLGPPVSLLPSRGAARLRLPGDAVVALILRDGTLFVPKGDTVLRHGDHLLLAVTDSHPPEVERELRAISRAGRLATWIGERGLVAR